MAVDELGSQVVSLGCPDISCNKRHVDCIDVRLDRRYCSKCAITVHMEDHLTSPVKVAACLYAEVNVSGVFWRATEGPKHSRAPSLLRIAASSKVQLPRENVRENPGPACRLHDYRLPSLFLGESTFARVPALSAVLSVLECLLEIQHCERCSGPGGR